MQLLPIVNDMASSDQSSDGLVLLTAVASKLLGRAVGACLAAGSSSAATYAHSVVLELQQCPQRPGLLGLRVCDDGLPLPAEQLPLERGASALGLGPLLAGCGLLVNGTLLAQSTGLDEVVVRKYSFQAAASRQVAVAAAGADAKPPGSTLRGSVFEATLLVCRESTQAAAGAEQDSGAAQYIQHLLAGGLGPGSAQLQLPAPEEVVACLQQLLGMMRVLAPPVRLLMRLHGVLLQGPDGALQPVSGSRRIDMPLDPSLDALARFGEGMASEFLPLEGEAAPTDAANPGAAGAANSVLDAAALMSGSEESLPEATAGTPAAGAAAAAGNVSQAGVPLRLAAAGAQHDPQQRPLHLEQQQEQQAGELPLLTFVGAGEAGWGCPGAAQHFRGCKWTARAGLVLQMPDHGRLAAMHAAAGAPGAAVQQQQQQGPPQPTPIFLFRSWGMQLEAQQHVLKGLERCDWASYGFQLDKAEGSSAGAPLSAVLQCAQPCSGAQLVAAVVHLVPCEHRTQAERGQLPPLSGGYEGRLVRQALEAALRQLKQQCPAVINSRRERSLARALPLLSKALTGILLQSEQCSAAGGSGEEQGDTPLQQACTMAACRPEALQQRMGELLQETVAAAMDGSGAVADGIGAAADGSGEGSGSKRQRQEGGTASQA